MTLKSGDLTTLANAKAYMANPPGDPIITSLITRISAHIRAVLNRNVLVPTTYVQQFSGQATKQLVLPEWPLLSLTSLAVSGISVPISPQVDTDVSPAVPYGYRFQPWNGVPPGQPAVLDLVGLNFLRGWQNVVATYTAGYQVTAEAQTIPAAPGPYVITPLAPYGAWATDQGVVNAATGAKFTPVASAPTAGQYVPPAPDASSPILTYTFNASDQNTPVLLTYGFVPADLEQVCIELIAERASYRNRVGLRSQSLASQESLTYDASGLPAYVVEMLRPYESVLPPAIGAPV